MTLSTRRYEFAQVPSRPGGRTFGTVCALLMLIVSPLCTVCVSASVLDVGPIYLTGSGSFYDPDLGGGEGLMGTLGLQLSATGSNGADSVSLNVSDVELLVGLEDIGGGFSVFSGPAIGSSLSFSASVGQCLEGYSSVYSTVQCSASIDGVTGIGSFTNLGGGDGIVQVFADIPATNYFFEPTAGPLLAQAEIISNTEFTSVTPGLPNSQEFQSTFALTSPDPPPDPAADPAADSTPEPSAGIMGFIGVAALACLRFRKNRRDNPPRRWGLTTPFARRMIHEEVLTQ